MAAVGGRELAAFFLFSTLWSGNWLVIKWGLADLPPFHFAGLRLVLACLLLAAIVPFLGRRPVSAREWRDVALVGFLQVRVSYGCVFTAERWIESGLAALLFSTFALWVAVLAHWFLPGEPLTPRTAVAALLGVAGVAVIQGSAVARAASGRLAPLAAGGLLMLASSLASAISVILVKRRLARVSPFSNVLGQSAVAAVALLRAAAFLRAWRGGALDSRRARGGRSGRSATSAWSARSSSWAPSGSCRACRSW
ncbi:MAG: DMT family transporter [Thermoanaerobaculia bacterium]